MNWVDAQLVLVSLAAMFSPTTLSWSILVLVLGDRPRRTGGWFYLGAMVATLGVGVLGAVVLGDVAASHKSTPKTWVAIVDVVAACLLLAYVLKVRNKPIAPETMDSMVSKMGRIAASPWIAIVGAGAVLANPGAFIPLALKAISETDPSTAQFILAWAVFSLLSLLPLAVAIILLVVKRDWAEPLLGRVRAWLLAHVRAVTAVILVLLAAVLLRHGISGLV